MNILQACRLLVDDQVFVVRSSRRSQDGQHSSGISSCCGETILYQRDYLSILPQISLHLTSTLHQIASLENSVLCLSLFYNHIDYCFVVFKNVKRSARVRKFSVCSEMFDIRQPGTFQQIGIFVYFFKLERFSDGSLRHKFPRIVICRESFS